MNQKKIAADKAAEFIKDGMIVGLGTGSTAKYLVDKVGEMVKNGLRIQAVATSRTTEIQARELGIPLLDIKVVDHLGKFPIPVEILPYGYKVVLQKLKKQGYNPVMRLKDGDLFVTDNGNYIVDLHLRLPVDSEDVKQKIDSIVGVLETGQFLKMCNCIIVGTDSGARIIEAENEI